MSIWHSPQFKLFFSHVAAHKGFAATIRDELSIRAISAFVAHDDIEPSQEWQDVIEAALRSADALAALLTPDFHESNWTDQEVGACMVRNVLILPVNLGLNPYGFIAKVQALNGSGKNSAQLAEEIFNTLVTHELTRTAMAEAIVASFESSPSYLDARRNIELVERVPELTVTQIARLRKAALANGQIGKAFGVAKKLGEFVASVGTKGAR